MCYYTDNENSNRKHKNTKTQKHKNTKTQKHENTKTQKLYHNGEEKRKICLQKRDFKGLLR